MFERQTGNVKAREVGKKTHGVKNAEGIWRHDPDPFRKIGNTAGEETRTKWKVWAEQDEGKGMVQGH